VAALARERDDDGEGGRPLADGERRSGEYVCWRLRLYAEDTESEVLGFETLSAVAAVAGFDNEDTAEDRALSDSTLEADTLTLPCSAVDSSNLLFTRSPL